jgi:hypothetical protein
MEYNTVRAYEPAYPNAPDVPMGQLIKNLAPGQKPTIRIGGDSTDWTWWPIKGVKQPLGINNSLSAGWVARARNLVSSTGGRLILGINLEADSPVIASTEADNLAAGIGRSNIEAFEIGNEPELYSQLPWYRNAGGVRVRGRTAAYNLGIYGQEFASVAGAMPAVPLAGPSISQSWLPQLPAFIRSAPNLQYVTYHAYGLNQGGDAFRGRNCSGGASQRSLPTVARLLAPIASRGLSVKLGPYVSLVHRRGLKFVVDEMNAVTCAGTPGVSDTFASALWALDTMFVMADANVDAVNVHTWRGSAGKLFAFSESTAGQWAAAVHPEYYGLLMFAQAAPPGSRLLGTEQTSGPVRAWADVTPNLALNVVLINDSLSQTSNVTVQSPAGVPALPATSEMLYAPNAASTTGVTLGCQSFGAWTTTGVLPAPTCLHRVTPQHGQYKVTLPPASAVLLSIKGPGYGPPTG